MARAPQHWLIDFEREREHHRRLLGRKELVTALDRALLDARPARGWLLVSGCAGVGKSALAVGYERHLLGRATAEGFGVIPVLHMIKPATDERHRPSRIRRALIARLSQIFPELSIPSEDVDLERVLAQLPELLQRKGPGARVVLILDGLDEAQAEATANPLPLFLPEELPDRVVGVCFSRPTSTVNDWFAGDGAVVAAPCIDLDDGAWSGSHLAASQEFWHRAASAGPLRALGRRQLEEAMDATAGKMLVATCLERHLQAAVATRATRLSHIEIGPLLEAKNPLEVLVRRQVTEAWQHPIAVLCALCEPIPATSFARLMGWSNDALALFRSDLAGILDAGRGALGLVHPLLRDTASEHLGETACRRAHGFVARRYARLPPPQEEARAYALRYVIHHRLRSGDIDEAWRLFRQVDLARERVEAGALAVIEDDLQAFMGQAAVASEVRETASALRRVLAAHAHHDAQLGPALEGVIFNGLVARGWTPPRITSRWSTTRAWPSLRLERALLATHGWLRSASDASCGWMTCCAATPDGEKVFTGHRTGSLRLWSHDLSHGRAVVDAHASGVLQCALSPDGRLVVTGAADGTVRAWSTVDLRPEAEMAAAALGAVYGLAFDPAGALVYVVSARGAVQRWDLATGAVDTLWSGRDGEVPRACAISSDGRSLLLGLESRTALVLSVEGARVRHELRGHGAAVRTCAALTGGDGAWVTGSWDGSIRVWAADGALRARVALRAGVRVLGVAALPAGKVAFVCDDGALGVWSGEEETAPWMLQGHQGKATGCAAANAARRLVTCGADGRVVLWDADAIPTGTGLGSAVCGCALDAERERAFVATVQGEVQARRLSDGRPIWSRAYPSASIAAVALDAHGERLALGVGASVAVLDAHTGRELGRLLGHAERVRCLEWLDDGALASGGDDGTIRLWRVAERSSEKVVAIDRGRVLSLAHANDLVAFGTSAGVVGVWSLGDGVVRTPHQHEAPTRSVHFLGPSTLWSVSSDGAVRASHLDCPGEVVSSALAGSSPVAVAWSGSDILIADASARLELWALAASAPYAPARPESMVLLTSRPTALSVSRRSLGQLNRDSLLVLGEDDGTVSVIRCGAGIDPTPVADVVILCSKGRLDLAERLEEMITRGLEPFTRVAICTDAAVTPSLRGALVACVADADLCQREGGVWATLCAEASPPWRAFLLAEVGVSSYPMPVDAERLHRYSGDDRSDNLPLFVLSFHVRRTLQSWGVPLLQPELLRRMNQVLDTAERALAFAVDLDAPAGLAQEYPLGTMQRSHILALLEARVPVDELTRALARWEEEC